VTAPRIQSGRTFPLRPHPHLYEINTWAWLEKLSARLGRLVKLDDVSDAEWDALARLGVDIVWLMGVWQRSAESRRIALADLSNTAQYDLALAGWTPEDVVGSPYAVARYVPDPRMGTWDSLDRVREKLHARGIALFLDFVGNHTALDHPWARQHPEFYVQGASEEFQEDPGSFRRVETASGVFSLALAKDPYFPPWKDAAQLNHFSTQMRAAHLADLQTIAVHCDGVRCDMAMLQLNEIFGKLWGRYLGGAKPPETEFWTEALVAVPHLVFLAESYWGTERRLLELGFSFVYDKGLYDAVRDVNMPEVHERVAADIGYQSRLARFLENHDEARWTTVFGDRRLVSVGTLMSTLPGMRFYHQNELSGSKIRLPITLRVGTDEPPDPLAVAFFANVLRITQDDVFHTGVWNLLQVKPEGDATPDGLVVYEWRSEKSWKLVAVNLSERASQGRVHFGDHALSPDDYTFHDVLNDVRYVRNGRELRDKGLFVRREGYQAHLFDVSPV
jgi:Alpha amylase, catalytic domain